MQSLIKAFFWGMMISFLGTLPIGTMNVITMQIGIQETLEQAYYFAAGAMLVEIIYVRVSLVAIDWILKRQKLMKYIEWATFFVILALAVGSFIAAAKGNGSAKSVSLDNNIHRFLLGMMMNALNPVQIPFWFGWSTVLFSKKVLEPKPVFYNIYVIGIGIGTMLGKTIYIVGGPWLVSKITNAQQYTNWVIGGIFTLTAIIQLIRIFRNKGIDSKMKNLKTNG